MGLNLVSMLEAAVSETRVNYRLCNTKSDKYVNGFNTVNIDNLWYCTICGAIICVLDYKCGRGVEWSNDTPKTNAITIVAEKLEAPVYYFLVDETKGTIRIIKQDNGFVHGDFSYGEASEWLMGLRETHRKFCRGTSDEKPLRKT